jgi:hypothetical protein
VTPLSPSVSPCHAVSQSTGCRLAQGAKGLEPEPESFGMTAASCTRIREYTSQSRTSCCRKKWGAIYCQSQTRSPAYEYSGAIFTSSVRASVGQPLANPPPGSRRRSPLHALLSAHGAAPGQGGSKSHEERQRELGVEAVSDLSSGLWLLVAFGGRPGHRAVRLGRAVRRQLRL